VCEGMVLCVVVLRAENVRIAAEYNVFSEDGLTSDDGAKRIHNLYSAQVIARLVKDDLNRKFVSGTGDTSNYKPIGPL
jgi:hypothetical protein